MSTDVEFIKEYAKCGIHHNHHGEKLEDKLKMLDMVIKRIALHERIYNELTELIDKKYELDEHASLEDLGLEVLNKLGYM